MGFRAFSLFLTLLLAGCMSGYDQPYKNQWSKAKNLANAAGMEEKLYDQELPDTAYDKKGKLLDYKLGGIFHPAYGSSSGIAGVNINPYGPFEHFYWGWTIPGVSHHSEHRVFAWMPLHMAPDSASAKHMMETMLSRASLAILHEMNYNYQAVKKPFIHEGRTFKQWYLGKADGTCSLQKMNCVLSLYVTEPKGPYRAPRFAFHNIAGEASWFFPARDKSAFPRLILAEGDGTKSISASIFYQRLSARLPGWAYFYIAPNEAGTGENNRTIPYPYVLEKGKPLLFIRPVSK
ncbi:hypothetical protein [Endozoicomonas elysicola]|uniref:Lipoprotein n=1 Tax=Endozoicomonas elysicola TaxID=305900 RepID=A0A081K8M6_9GAMM|nr:hypothetical protein [Endozoicomonas elysicola]KEI70502.1 hypothetical protein GV64_06915 [Endozoicomonas elysicola]